MSKLSYLKCEIPEQSPLQYYHVQSMYDYPGIKNDFINLRANIVDLNPALITKCIQGTEQDFVMLMNKAKDFLKINRNSKDNDAKILLLLDLFQECVFGYYVLTPLLKARDVSDIKIYAWNHITCKANGKRYLTNVSFASEDDYDHWFERMIRIQRLKKNKDYSLQHCTDIKGVENDFLRIDVELSFVTSTGIPNLHIRKVPKGKYSWEYLKENGMLDDEMQEYIKNRVIAGYSFLISGKGGSGKTALLNNMLDLIPLDESGLIVQESDELYSKHPQLQFEHTISEIREGKDFELVSLEDLLRIGLLQDIDNFVVGEIKGGEALYVFTTAVSTGARFMGTIHSQCH